MTGDAPTAGRRGFLKSGAAALGGVSLTGSGLLTHEIDAREFGAGSAGSDHASIQAAIDEAAKRMEKRGEIETFRSVVRLEGPGPYETDAPLVLRRGVHLAGSDQRVTTLLHTATDGSNIIQSQTDAAAVHSGVSNMTIVGNGPGNTGAGIRLVRDYFDGRVSRISITDCTTALELERCWTLQLRYVHAYNNGQGLDWRNATAARIVGSRFDASQGVGAHIRDADGQTTLGLDIRNTAFQRSGRQGLLLESPNAFLGGGCFFENNNRDDDGHAYLETRGTGGNVKVGVAYFTEGTDLVQPAMRFSGPENVVLAGTRVSTSTTFDHAVAGSGDLDILVVVGGVLFGTEGRFDLHPSTELVPVGTKGVSPYSALESGEVGIGADPVRGASLRVLRDGGGRVLLDGNNDSRLDLNAPRDRKNDIRWQAGGRTRVYEGRGDDDALPPDVWYVDGASSPEDPALAVDAGDRGVEMHQLPTSDPEVEGRLWNDDGTVKVSGG